uniref:Uncharacterized protein n=1 Tax=Panagrolaimus sp. JU765 TaxID=591449 RepID=A0AC34Q8K9_9BILA
MTDNLVRVAGFIVEVKDEGKTEEFCNLMEEKHIEVERLDGSSTKKNEVDCNPDELVKASNMFFLLKPPDLMQSSAKLWLGAVYTVKLFFLGFKVLAKSHESLRRLLELAASECNGKLAGDFEEAWTFAE